MATLPENPGALIDASPAAEKNTSQVASPLPLPAQPAAARTVASAAASPRAAAPPVTAQVAAPSQGIAASEASALVALPDGATTEPLADAATESAAPLASPPPPDPSAEFEGDTFSWSAEAAQANEMVFADGPLRPLQQRAVNAAMSGRDLLVVMPTGAGKSRCFHLAALLSPGLTVVVAPLLSLILDQVESLSRRRVRALYLASTQTPEEAQQVYAELNRSPPACKLLYVTPERLQQSMHLRAALSRLHAAGLLSRLVVDEAHCVISWGRDFRPDYLSIGPWRSEMPGVRTTLLTATLPPAMRPELLEALELRQSEVVVVKSALDRPNLSYEVWPKPAPRAAADLVAELLRAAPEGQGCRVQGAGCAIVYCHSQAETERVCDALIERGLSAAFYHAMVDPEVKQMHHAQWMAGDVQVMVATSAFGMGVRSQPPYRP